MQRLCVHAVSTYAPPCYPALLEALARPSLLEEHVPLRWIGNEELKALLAVSLACAPIGCSRSDDAGSGGSTLSPTARAVSAPLARFGVGVAPERVLVMGDVATPVASQVLLSEEEALDIIREELFGAGIRTLDEDVTIPGVEIDGIRDAVTLNWQNGQVSRDWVPDITPLVADLYSPDLRIAIEFVSASDFESSCGPAGDIWKPDLKAAAEHAAECVAAQGRGVYFASFYDPVKEYWWGGKPSKGADQVEADGSPRYANSQEEAITEAQRLLRLQVQAFIEWLKGQGVI